MDMNLAITFLSKLLFAYLRIANWLWENWNASSQGGTGGAIAWAPHVLMSLNLSFYVSYYLCASGLVSAIRMDTAVTRPTIPASTGKRTSRTSLRDWGWGTRSKRLSLSSHHEQT